MSKVIVVLGATGNLGGKIVDALLLKGATVKVIARLQTDKNKLQMLQNKAVQVLQIDTTNQADVAKHLAGADCVVSALAGLRDTIIDAQKIFLDAAVAAKVPRFIPSDYSIEFTNLIAGQNRNLDLRREFHTYVDEAPIKPTSIFNGVFMDLLTAEMPLIMQKKKRILCWGNPDQLFELTTTYNIAAFTAAAALDDESPRFLRIAGDKLSSRQFVNLLTTLTGKKYRLFRPGGIGLLNTMIGLTKFFAPAKNELYPAWQGMQYMRDMMEGRVIFQGYDNARYPGIEWTSAKEYLSNSKMF